MIASQLLGVLLKTPAFTSFIQRFGYIGILTWFLTFDQLTPIPEEVSLLIIGYFSAHHIFNPFIAGIFSLAGFLTIDTIYFFLSKKGSSLIKKKTKGFSALMQSYRQKLQSNTPKAIVILCFIPRMRLFAPILAGSMKLSFRRFLLYDSAALSVFTALYLLLGIIFNRSLAGLVSKTKWLQNVLFFSALFVITITVILVIARRRKKSGSD